jgi:hypothetical protein
MNLSHVAQNVKVPSDLFLLMIFMKNVNAEWHRTHRMPKNPTMDERIKWHIEHEKYCRCRPIPETVLEAIKKQTTNPPQVK